MTHQLSGLLELEPAHQLIDFRLTDHLVPHRQRVREVPDQLEHHEAEVAVVLIKTQPDRRRVGSVSAKY